MRPHATEAMDQPAPRPRPATLGELRALGYRSRSVKQEMRTNLLRLLAADAPLFEGIVGYETSVLPAIQNAVLAGQDIVLLGERGQAKTRIARALASLLDEAIPMIAGTELREDPFAPITTATRDLVAAKGDETPVEWLPRDRRYGEKLATPDITIADLVGEVDPIKVAEGRYLADESTIPLGLIPPHQPGHPGHQRAAPTSPSGSRWACSTCSRSGRPGPRGYTHALTARPDFVATTANPEDYTSR